MTRCECPATVRGQGWRDRKLTVAPRWWSDPDFAGRAGAWHHRAGNGRHAGAHETMTATDTPDADATSGGGDPGAGDVATDLAGPRGPGDVAAGGPPGDDGAGGGDGDGRDGGPEGTSLLSDRLVGRLASGRHPGPLPGRSARPARDRRRRLPAGVRPRPHRAAGAQRRPRRGAGGPVLAGRVEPSRCRRVLRHGPLLLGDGWHVGEHEHRRARPSTGPPSPEWPSWPGGGAASPSCS